MPVGNALGHPVKFLPAKEAPHKCCLGKVCFDLEAFKVHGKLRKPLKRGHWADDASMGLCMADSLIWRRGFDGSAMRVRFGC